MNSTRNKLYPTGVIKKVSYRFIRPSQRRFLEFSLLLVFSLRQALADLPTAVDPSTGAPDGNWLELVKGYIKDGAVIIGLALSTVGFIWVSWTALAKFNEARRSRGDVEWGEVGMLTIVGGALLLFITFLLNEAAVVFDAA